MVGLRARDREQAPTGLVRPDLGGQGEGLGGSDIVGDGWTEVSGRFTSWGHVVSELYLSTVSIP